MLIIKFGTFPIIETENLILRNICTGDAEELFKMRSDMRMMQFIDRPLATSIDDAMQLIDKMQNGYKNNEGISWAITKKNNPKLIGNIGFWRIDKENHRAEIGYSLHPDQHRKGVMTEAIMPVLDYGFREIKFHSIEANVNKDNIASMKLLEKAGFIQEAYFRENYFYDGVFLDSVIYSVLTPFCF